jgi:hypothetical protein
LTKFYLGKRQDKKVQTREYKYKKILRQCSILAVNFWSVTFFGVFNFGDSIVLTWFFMCLKFNSNTHVQFVKMLIVFIQVEKGFGHHGLFPTCDPSRLIF